MGKPAATYAGSVGTCPACGKQSFLSKRAARTFAKKKWPGDKINGYECPDNEGYFHYGHLQRKVKQGRMPRALLVEGRTLSR